MPHAEGLTLLPGLTPGGSLVDSMAVAPEIALWIFACLALVVEWIRPRGLKGAAAGLLSAEMVSAAGLFLALMLTLLQASGGVPHPAFHATLVSDPLTWYYKGLCILASLILMPSCWRYMEGRPNRPEFYGLMLLATSAMALMVESIDLILFFLAIEFLSITSFVLVGYLKGSRRSSEASVKYFLFGAICSALMLYGMSILYGLTGSVNYYTIGARLPAASALPGALMVLTLVLFFAGIGFKISMWPFHMWAPDAYEGAPTPVTAFLAVGPKLAGIAVFVRVVQTMFRQELDWPLILGIAALITMTWGNLAALAQTNFKRMLAYSSIAQAGYLLVGVVSLVVVTQSAPEGGILSGAPARLADAVQYATPAVLIYSTAYLIMNLGAFIVAIEVEREAGTSDIAGFAGLGQRNPAMAAAMTVFLLGLGGIPLTVGFIGKLYLFGAAVAGAAYSSNAMLWLLAAFGVANSVVSIYYYFRIVHPMWLQESDLGSQPSWGGIGILAGFLALITVGFGVFGQAIILPSYQLQGIYTTALAESSSAPPARVAALRRP